MTVPDYVPPAFLQDAFHCPLCSAYAHMAWRQLMDSGDFSRLHRARCQRCQRMSYWLEVVAEQGVLLSPRTQGGVLPHPEMPENSRTLYEEARAAASVSPRAAVALLRVAADVLLREVVPGAGSQGLSDVIGLAVKQGLSPHVQVALDALRVHGNDAVHPAQLIIDEPDAPGLVTGLCQQLNLVVEQLISVPRQMQQAFEALPEGVRKQIEKRDGRLPYADPEG